MGKGSNCTKNNMNYKIITDENILDSFLQTLPDTKDSEVYYVCLFGRHKYDNTFPNTRDAGQLARIASKKQDLKEKIRRLETPVGSYTRDNIAAPQEALATYIGLNPRSLIKANKNLLVELAKRFADGNTNFNPITLATTEIHRATDRKFFVDFDYDNTEPAEHLPVIQNTLPKDAYQILKTRGGFHLIVELEKVEILKTNWYLTLAQLKNCDVKGSGNLTPIPGCTQGGFTPYFL